MTLTLTDTVDFDQQLTPADVAEGEQWPPDRFRARLERLDLLFGLWAGVWPDGVDLGQVPVSVNTFQAYSTRLANLLLSSEPETDAEIMATGAPDAEIPLGQENLLIDVCQDALTDLVRYGGAVVARVGSSVVVPDPRTYLPGEEGESYFVRLLTLAELDTDNTGMPNTIEITTASDGAVTRHKWDGIGDGTIGAVVSRDVIDPVRVEVIPRPPVQGTWGTSKYVAMYQPTLEIARRYSRNSRIFNLYSGPVPVFQESDIDARVRFNVDPSDDEGEARRKIQAGQMEILGEESIHLPDNLIGVSYLQPNVQGTSYALAQVTDLREHIRDVTGLPDLTGQTVSGDALKRLFVHFYAETAAIQRRLRLALERILEAPVAWPHIFDTNIFADASIMAAPPTQPAAEPTTTQVVETVEVSE